ncbi:HlyC/CorC family transporter [Xinfangfangia sp. D13-10-4-6]|uniref:transporter associated domain-containing protein n=1 Tax=Pseudogemmobacter hezensis TaxID=2737662 RepID=UPI001555748E|nr:hemolysin family protein [Pseudogemmobacter hezensis]NPD16448.1 HlyC/CorC family transporter [Pseudogemmobacter hezensis]
MGSSSDGTVGAQDAPETGSTASLDAPTARGGAEQNAGQNAGQSVSQSGGGGRGFFGRLIAAFSNSEAGGGELSADGASQALALLAEVRVDDIAIPKAEIVAVPLDIGLTDLVRVFREHGFSRLPVYDESLDHPQGLVLLKDVALRFGFGEEAPFVLKDLLRPILFAPPSMPAAVLLQKMQKERAHMALVIDEYGGVDGLATFEDLIETVIGEIEDEHDEVAGLLWKEEAPGVILVQSTAELEDLETAFGIRLRGPAEDDEIDTIGGLVFLRTGHVPVKGEVITLENGATLEVVDADVRRIKWLRLRLPGLTGGLAAAAAAATSAN